jgi:hypothetical protein
MPVSAGSPPKIQPEIADSQQQHDGIDAAAANHSRCRFRCRRRNEKRLKAPAFAWLRRDKLEDRKAELLMAPHLQHPVKRYLMPPRLQSRRGEAPTRLV